MYSDILRYALLSRLAYYDYDITFEELNVVSKSLESILFINSSSQVWIFKDDVEKELIIAFRGTDSLGDLIANFNIRPCLFHDRFITHSGYCDAYHVVRNAILYCLFENIKRSQLQKVTVCGHSLGGTVACFCAFDLTNMISVPVSCYTYGALAGARDKFYADLVSRAHTVKRVVHHRDFAPHIPMLFYNHPPNVIRLSNILNANTQLFNAKNRSQFRCPLLSNIHNYIRHHSIESYIGVIRHHIAH